MAIGAHTALIDERIDEYSPATARMFQNVRDNTYQIGAPLCCLPGGQAGGVLPTAAHGTWTTFWTVPIALTANAIGPSGTRLVLQARPFVGAGSSRTAALRCKIGSDTSNELEAFTWQFFSDPVVLTLDFQTTAGVVDLEFQDENPGGITAGALYWCAGFNISGGADAECYGYLMALG